MGALFDTLSLDEFVILLEIVDTLRKFTVDLGESGFQLVIADNIMRSRENSRMGNNSLHRACNSVYFGYTVDLVAEVFDTDSHIR